MPSADVAAETESLAAKGPVETEVAVKSVRTGKLFSRRAGVALTGKFFPDRLAFLLIFSALFIVVSCLAADVPFTSDGAGAAEFAFESRETENDFTSFLSLPGATGVGEREEADERDAAEIAGFGGDVDSVLSVVESVSANAFFPWVEAVTAGVRAPTDWPGEFFESEVFI